MNVQLALAGVKARYGEPDVLKGISLTVQAGETVCLIGPNGHGKTTLLKAISGLLRHVEGSITFGDQELVGRSPEWIVSQGVVHIPQGDLLFMGMTVEDNLLMGAHSSKAYPVRHSSMERVYSLLPQLAERRRQHANSLSGGERRMLAIGRGLMGSAQLLLLDEPSLGLAPIVIDSVYELIRQLRSQGITILLVEENASRIVDVADRVHLIDDGRIVWSGTGAEVESSASLLETYLGA